MANTHFRVATDLEVGALTISATTGDISTTGNVTVSGSGSINTPALGVSSISKNDSTITINDTGTGSSIVNVVDGVTKSTLDTTGLVVVGNANATTFYGSGAGLNSIPSSAIIGGVISSGNITIGSTTINLGNTSTTLAGLSSVTSTSFTGTLATAAQPNITSLGTLTGLTLAGNVLPSANVTYDLGSPTAQWHSLYVGPGSLYVNNQKVLQDTSGTIVFSADTNQNISIQTKGSGVTEIAPDVANGGYIALKSTVQILGGYHITTSDASALGIPNGIAADSISAHSTNATLNINQQGSGTVAINSPTTVTGA
jgi:hypothetical protein